MGSLSPSFTLACPVRAWPAAFVSTKLTLYTVRVSAEERAWGLKVLATSRKLVVSGSASGGSSPNKVHLLTPIMATTPKPDLLDHMQTFLAKREGIDKTLKIIRYSSRLLAALTPDDAELHKRLDALQSSLGVSRKAFRLGKFLQDINALRKSRTTGGTYLLEVLAYGGEGVYYFIEQIVWLMKAGALTKEHEARLSYCSAWAELVGYLASIWISCHKMDAISSDITTLERKQDRCSKEDGEFGPEQAQKLEMYKKARILRAAIILQDLADMVIAANDLRGGKDPFLGHPVTLALAGLLSAGVSTYKNWTAC